jgi:hypothetical protein
MSLAFHYYAATILGALDLFAKHILHITGLPCVGLNGTVVLLRHSEQVTGVSIVRRPPLPCLFALHCLQCFGSLTNPFSRKNSCSPEENTNITPQLTHWTSRSAKGMAPSNSKVIEEFSGDRSPSMKTRCVLGIILPLKLENMLGTQHWWEVFRSQGTAHFHGVWFAQWSARAVNRHVGSFIPYGVNLALGPWGSQFAFRVSAGRQSFPV